MYLEVEVVRGLKVSDCCIGGGNARSSGLVGVGLSGDVLGAAVLWGCAGRPAPGLQAAATGSQPIGHLFPGRLQPASALPRPLQETAPTVSTMQHALALFATIVLLQVGKPKAKGHREYTPGVCSHICGPLEKKDGMHTRQCEHPVGSSASRCTCSACDILEGSKNSLTKLKITSKDPQPGSESDQVRDANVPGTAGTRQQGELSKIDTKRSGAGGDSGVPGRGRSRRQG